MEQLVLNYFSNYLDFHIPNLAIDYQPAIPTPTPNLDLVVRTDFCVVVVVVVVAVAALNLLVSVKLSDLSVARGVAFVQATHQSLPIHHQNEGSNLIHYHPHFEYELRRDRLHQPRAKLRFDQVPKN